MRQEGKIPKRRFAGFVDEWVSRRLDEIGTVIRGSSPRPQGDRRYYGGNVPRLMVADVTRDGKFVTPRIDFLTEEGARLSRPCKAGTLTIVCSGTVGIPSILAIDACIHDGFLALIDINETVSQDYVYHQLTTLRDKLERSATHGGIFTNLTTTSIKQFEIAIPSYSEQQKIAACLSTMDKKIAQLARKKKLLLNYKKGVMQQIFEREIRFKDGNGKDFPDWEPRELGNVTVWGSGGTPSKDNEHYWNGDIPWISASSMRGQKYYDSDRKVTSDGLHNGSRLAPAGSLLILVRGSMLFKSIPVGLATRDVAFNQDVKSIKCDKALSPCFLLYFLLYSERRLLSMVTGTGIGAGKLDLDDLKKMTVSVPCSDEQNKINSFLTALDEKIELVAQQLEKAKTFKRGLLQQMFV
jgi:type I restriction enzyme S subunit